MYTVHLEFLGKIYDCKWIADINSRLDSTLIVV
jgi:hypothetical protein